MDKFTKIRRIQSERNFKCKYLKKSALRWQDISRNYKYQYMFDWLGLPIIQDPQDICYLQEIIWETKPDIIIECGIARGGSLILYASIAKSYSTKKKNTKIIGIDIKINKKNYNRIKSHPLGKYIKLIEQTSDSPELFKKIKKITKNKNVLVILDSNHTEKHVLSELNLFSKLLKKKNYIFVMDTGIQFANFKSFKNKRPWSINNNPYSAVKKFMKTEQGKKFRIEHKYEKRFILTSSPSGLLKRIK